MSTNNYFQPTLDPTTLPFVEGPLGTAQGITASHLYQLVRELQPEDGYGFVVWGTTAPDTDTYPELVRFLWIDTTDTPHVLKEWNGATWEAFVPAEGSLNGNVLIDNTVTLSKLAVNVSDFGKVLIARSGGPAWENLADNIGTASIPFSKLLAPAGPVGAYLTLTSANQLGWQVLHGEDIISRIVNGTLPINRLVAPGATVGHVLKVHTDNTIITAADEVGEGGPSGLPSIGGSDSGKHVVVNGASDAYELVAPVTPTIPNKYVSAPQTLPTSPGTSGTINSGGMVRLAHGLGETPHITQATLVCQSADAGYAVGAAISLADIYAHSSPISTSEISRPLFQAYADGTYLWVVRAAAPYFVEAHVMSLDPSGARNAVIDLSKWKVRLVAIKFN